MKEWNIGEKAQIIPFEAVPAERKEKHSMRNPLKWSPGKMRVCGKYCKIVEKMYSDDYGCYVYLVEVDGATRPSDARFCGDDFTEIPGDDEKVGFSFSVQALEGGVVVAKMFDGTTQIGIGHAHVFRDGAIGLMQAASFAMKRCYENMGGTFRSDNTENIRVMRCGGASRG